MLDASDRLVRETTAEYRWQVLSPAGLLAEVSTAGFKAIVGPFDVVRAVATLPS
ncbi:hypothetical protein [Micromonospora sp. SH-82]|uniref:hypothetical protein n=1 Tax=Micromonospora sp. SH-82 TaxID=3132938 RepID=UPI003EB6A1E2